MAKENSEKNCTVASVVIGSDVEGAVEELRNYSEKVYVISAETLKNYTLLSGFAANPPARACIAGCSKEYTLRGYAAAFANLVKEHNPEMILIGATGIGSELAPTVAAKVKTGLAAHCIDIMIADKLDGAVGWTRAFIDTGIVDSENQMIGTSGKSVKPNVFLGFGISGAAHFTCGMAKSKLIIEQ